MNSFAYAPLQASFFIFALLLSCASWDALAGDFRGVTWGATQEEVLAAEGSKGPNIRRRSRLSYTGTLGDGTYSASINYVFNPDSGALDEGVYWIQKRRNSQALDDFYFFERKLTEKYDKKTDATVTWKDSLKSNLYKPFKFKHGAAVEKGLLFLTNEWQTNRTYVLQELYKASIGSVVVHTIRYIDKSALERKLEEARGIEEAKRWASEYARDLKVGRDPSVMDDL